MQATISGFATQHHSVQSRSAHTWARKSRLWAGCTMCAAWVVSILSSCVTVGGLCRRWLMMKPHLPRCAGELANESVISLTGRVVREAQAPGGFELHQPQIEVITTGAGSAAGGDQQTRSDGQFAQLARPRRGHQSAPGAAGGLSPGRGVMAAFRAVLTAHDFTEVQTPKLVASATESGANVFQHRLFWAARLSGAESAVLQADHGRRL